MNPIEQELYHRYLTNPIELWQSLNLNAITDLMILGSSTTNATSLQLIGALVASWIDNNYEQINKDFAYQIYTWALTTCSNLIGPLYQQQINAAPIYLFFGKIVANLIFHFYGQSTISQVFGNDLNTYMLNNSHSYAIYSGILILQAVIERFKPPHNLHKESYLTMAFYGANLDFILTFITRLIQDDQIDTQLQVFHDYSTLKPLILNASFDLLLSILQIEFATDVRQKDWHKLKQGPLLKPSWSLLSDISQINSANIIIPKEVMTTMISNFDILGNFSQHNQRIWKLLKSEGFVNGLIKALSTQNDSIWSVLKLICKIFRKHFTKDEESNRLFQVMTKEFQMMQLQLQQQDYLLQYIKFARRLITYPLNADYILFNCNLINQILDTGNQYYCLYSFKFLREICRVIRIYDYSQLKDILDFCISTVIRFQTAIYPLINWSTNSIYKQIRCCFKVIIHLNIDKFFEILNQQLSNTALDYTTLANTFDLYSLGLFSSMECTNYQLKSKLRHNQVAPHMEPIMDLQLFLNQYDQRVLIYKDSFQQSIQMLSYLSQNPANPSKLIEISKSYYSLLFKNIFSTNTFKVTDLKVDQVIKVISDSFKCIADALQTEIEIGWAMKCLRLFLDSSVQIDHLEKQFIRLGETLIPLEALFPIRQQQTQAMMQTLYSKANKQYGRNFYSAQMKILNMEIAFLDIDDTVAVVNKFLATFDPVFENISSTKQMQFAIEIFRGLFTINNLSFSYQPIYNYLDGKGLFKIILQTLKDQPLCGILSFTEAIIQENNIKKISLQQTYEFLAYLHTLILHTNEYLIKQQLSSSRQLNNSTYKDNEIYKNYYKPLIKLLKVIFNFQYISQGNHKCNEIYPIIFDLIDRIVIEDIKHYIHSMKPLFRICGWLLSFQKIKQLIFSQYPGLLSKLILIFIAGIDSQEQVALIHSLGGIKEILNYLMKDKVQLTNLQLPLKVCVESCLMLAFEYNSRLSEASQSLLRFVILYPGEYDSLMANLKLRIQSRKSLEWQQIYDLFIQQIKSKFPYYMNGKGDSEVYDLLRQLQRFYLYYL